MHEDLCTIIHYYLQSWPDSHLGQSCLSFALQFLWRLFWKLMWAIQPSGTPKYKGCYFRWSPWSQGHETPVHSGLMFWLDCPVWLEPDPPLCCQQPFLRVPHTYALHESTEDWGGGSILVGNWNKLYIKIYKRRRCHITYPLLYVTLTLLIARYVGILIGDYDLIHVKYRNLNIAYYWS